MFLESSSLHHASFKGKNYAYFYRVIFPRCRNDAMKDSSAVIGQDNVFINFKFFSSKTIHLPVDNDFSLSDTFQTRVLTDGRNEQ